MITVETKYLPPSEPSLPALALQITSLVGSYMLWIGTTDPAAGPDAAAQAPLHGSLARDWACAMPALTPGLPAPATSLFRSSSSDVALAMAQRLARRFQKQIFLSVDVPPSFLSMGQGPKLAMEMERGIVATLKEKEAEQSRS
ncbi:hypothetical protein FIBSPDRAFT_791626 [Athelia psychrophila]|uniref:Proteasome assembly chaperone 3 n=1 Tax=Athelia psychrophila TaxID=1759441 RepID=A0A166HCY7_9AGAM|nr:hypothetical protein FIBSPDRAFT_791626 [Fibularhizoctonia sp. CBS 109695]